jgi:hypothetical protein
MEGRSLELLSADGEFPNGVSAPAVVQLILDYGESARLEDVAEHFHLTGEEVVAALEYCAFHFERLRAAGLLVR